MHADGSQQANLSGSESANWMPAWSPDGEQLVFASDRNGGSHVLIMSADGSRVTDLWEVGDQTADGDHPAWSPDGQWIVFASSQEGDPELYLLGIDGTGLTRLTTNDHDALDDRPAWSLDGRIAFHSPRDGLGDIYVMNRDGSDQTNLTNTPDWDEWDPAWSPDGKWIAYASCQDSNAEIYVMKADGSSPRRLTHNEVADEHPTWSPDGQWLAFQGDRDGNWEICIVRADGSAEVQLTKNEAADTYPAWRPVLTEQAGSAGVQATPRAAATVAPSAYPAPTGEGEQAPAMGGLKSYRLHGERRENGSAGAIKSAWDVEAVVSPMAYHLTSTGDVEMEVIMVERTIWTRMADEPWQRSEIPADQPPESALGTAAGVSVVTELPAEDSIQWLIGGHSAHIAKGSLKQTGSDTANGVRCRHYTVDSRMVETVTMPAPVSSTATNTYVTEGLLWVANQGDLPPFVVRVRVTEVITTQTSGASNTVTEYLSQDVTDINGAIDIQPPM